MCPDGNQTHNLGISGQHSDPLSYLARVIEFLNKLSLIVRVLALKPFLTRIQVPRLWNEGLTPGTVSLSALLVNILRAILIKWGMGTDQKTERVRTNAQNWRF